MSTLAIVIVSVVGSLIYIVIAGVVGGITMKKIDEHDFWMQPGPFFAALLWPLYGPFLIMATVAEAVATDKSLNPRKP